MPSVLPLVPSIPEYTFATALNSNVYVIRMRWNARASTWFMDISDSEETLVLAGMACLLGCKIGLNSANTSFPAGMFLMVDTSGTGIDATLDDMGTRIQIWHYSADELESYETL